MKNPLISTAEKIDSIKKKARKTVRGWKFRLLAVLIGLSLAVGLTFLGFYNVSKWYDQHEVKFHSPIEVRLFPVVSVVKRETGLKSVSGAYILPKEKQLWEDEEFLTNIYELTRRFESNYGRDNGDLTALHLYCQKNNMLNEIGYAPHDNFCFKSYWDQETTFKKWLVKRLRDEKLSIIEAVCKYTTGLIQPQCKRSMEMGL